MNTVLLAPGSRRLLNNKPPTHSPHQHCPDPSLGPRSSQGAHRRTSIIGQDICSEDMEMSSFSMPAEPRGASRALCQLPSRAED